MLQRLPRAQQKAVERRKVARQFLQSFQIDRLMIPEGRHRRASQAAQMRALTDCRTQVFGQRADIGAFGTTPPHPEAEIGRASGRERGCQSVKTSVVTVT